MKAVPIQNTVTNYISSVERRLHAMSGMPHEFRELCEPFRKDLTLIAGENPTGECSTLSATLALQLAKAGARVLYIAHPRHRIQRYVFNFMCVDSGQVWATLRYDEQRIKILKEHSGTLDNLNFFYSPMQSPQKIEDILAMIYNAVGNFEIDYVFIDSLEDCTTDEHHLELESKMEYICRCLQSFTDDFSIPIVAIAKYDFDPKYDCDEDGLVSIEDLLRETRYFDYAKNIYFPYRPEYYHIYKDEKTGENLSRVLRVYPCRRGLYRDNPIRLMFDGKNARVTIFPEKSEEAKVDDQPSLFSELHKNDDLPF